jgi:polyisoprenoid-binding protein YceI
MARAAGVVWMALAAMAGTGRAVAQHQTFHVNPDRSTVRFSFEGAQPAVAGTFRVAKSAIEFDKQGPKIGGSVIVKAATERSGAGDRDKAIQTQVLDAPAFAEIVFEPKSFTGSVDVSDGKSVIQVTGTLTLHGVPHEVTVPVEFTSNGNRATVRTRLMVPYVEWGLQALSGVTMKAGPQVQVDLVLVGFLTPEN